jgi:hypothetical protein
MSNLNSFRNTNSKLYQNNYHTTNNTNNTNYEAEI